MPDRTGSTLDEACLRPYVHRPGCIMDGCDCGAAARRDTVHIDLRKPQTVWVVSAGEHYEGGRVLAVFSERPNDETIVDLARPLGVRWEKYSDNVWVDGCDFLDVKEHELR